MRCHSFILPFLSLLQVLNATPFSRAGVSRRAAQAIRLPGSSNDTTRSRPPGTDTQCLNTASNRLCWGGGYNIDTNVETAWPTTGRTVKYDLTITNTTFAPDGSSREAYLVNGQYPGPTLRANWGDYMEVTVRNALETNGTSMHWHGVRQWNTNPMDGTNGITECPLAPGTSRTYRFQATQYGTSWYHSHHGSQYSDGVFGPIVIDGPTSANYDFDLGAMTVSDWFHEPSGSIIYKLSRAQIRGSPVADTILINGTNADPAGNGTYHRNTLEKGKVYKLRLINTSTNDMYRVGLDDHTLKVVAMDFVPIVPYDTNWLNIGVGQRYDVLINATQATSNYYFHVVPQDVCSSNAVTNGLAIFSYKDANNTTPSNGTEANQPTENNCDDPNTHLFPWVSLDVPSNETIPNSSQLGVGFQIINNGTSGSQSTVQWTLNFTAIHAPWDNPTLKYVADGNTSYPPSMNLISLPKKSQWSYWIIQALPTVAPAQAHPMHLHGHDFYILGAGTGNYTNGATTLNFINPPRRDVAMLPQNGYLVLAFVTDNPGAWLMHCHVAWHIDLGLGAQFLERVDEIPRIVDEAEPAFSDQCLQWDVYDDHAVYPEEGSGLKMMI